jgi:hypothetical protein
MLTAERLKVQSATAEVRELLASLTLEQCFARELWGELRFFAKVRPQGDIAPVRAAYGPTQDNFTIGLNPLWSDIPVWVAGPDLVASMLLTGRPPEVSEAVRVVPVAAARRRQARQGRADRVHAEAADHPQCDRAQRHAVAARAQPREDLIFETVANDCALQLRATRPPPCK